MKWVIGLSEDRETVLARIRDALRDVGEYESKRDVDYALNDLIDEVESRLRDVCDEEYEFIDLAGEERLDEGELFVATVRCNGHVFEIHIELIEDVTYIARYAGVKP